MVTLRRNDELKVAKTVIEIPVNLALEIFSEAGDLPIGKYPALEELAQIIAQVLNVGDETKSLASLEAVENNRVMMTNEKTGLKGHNIMKNTSRIWMTKEHARTLNEINEISEKPSFDSIEKLEEKEKMRARAGNVRDNMAYEKMGRGRLFRRKDGKYLIYIPKNLAEDSMFPFRGGSSTLVKIRISDEGDKLIIKRCKERKKDSDHGMHIRTLEKMFQRKD